MASEDFGSDILRADGGERGTARTHVRQRSEDHPDKPWRDEDLVRELYEEQELSIRQTADAIGCASSTLRYWLVNHHDIEVRSMAEGKRARSKGSRNRVPFMTSPVGYERWRASVRSEPIDINVHRLVAVAEYGFDAVCDKDVHHKNGIKWDNRPENLVPLDPDEHRELHMEELRYGNRQQIADVYEYSDGSQQAVGDAFGISASAVRSIHQEFYDAPAGDDTIFQGHACAHCGDRIKLDDVTADEPYEVPNRDREAFYCSQDCRYEADADPLLLPSETAEDGGSA